MIDPDEARAVAAADQIDALCRDLVKTATHVLRDTMRRGHADDEVATPYLHSLRQITPENTTAALSQMCTAYAASLIERAAETGEPDDRICACQRCAPPTAGRNSRRR